MPLNSLPTRVVEVLLRCRCLPCAYDLAGLLCLGHYGGYGAPGRRNFIPDSGQNYRNTGIPGSGGSGEIPVLQQDTAKRGCSLLAHVLWPILGAGCSPTTLLNEPPQHTAIQGTFIRYFPLMLYASAENRGWGVGCIESRSYHIGTLQGTLNCKVPYKVPWP